MTWAQECNKNLIPTEKESLQVKTQNSVLPLRC